MNDTILRLERTEDKLTSLQNQMICLQKRLQQLDSKTSEGSAHTQNTVPFDPNISSSGTGSHSNTKLAKNVRILEKQGFVSFALNVFKLMVGLFQ